MFLKHFWFTPRKDSWEFQKIPNSLPKIEHFARAIAHAFCSIVLGCAKIWPMVRISWMFQKILLGLCGIYLLYICLMYIFYLQELWRFRFGWFGQNFTAKTSIWKGHNSYSLRSTLDKCFGNTSDLRQGRIPESFRRFRIVCPKSSILQGL